MGPSPILISILVQRRTVDVSHEMGRPVRHCTSRTTQLDSVIQTEKVISSAPLVSEQLFMKVCSHAGVLCGSCVNGTGVGVLRSVCRECRTQSYYAIGFLGEPLHTVTPRICRSSINNSLCSLSHTHAVIGDILVIGFILFAALKLHLVFPHSFKGLLFYIQTVYYVTEYFPISFFDIRKYVRMNS